MTESGKAFMNGTIVIDGKKYTFENGCLKNNEDPVEEQELIFMQENLFEDIIYFGVQKTELRVI